MLRQSQCLFVACCLVFLTLSLSTSVSPSPTTVSPDLVNKSMQEQFPSGNSSDPQCDAAKAWTVNTSNGSHVCLVRTWPPDCVGYIALSAIAGFTALFLTLPCVLAAIGFGFIGITAGSIAALFQGSCGTPICFRCMQSTAMLGSPLSQRAMFGVVGLIVCGLVGAYWLPMCFTEQGSAVFGPENYTFYVDEVKEFSRHTLTVLDTVTHKVSFANDTTH